MTETIDRRSGQNLSITCADEDADSVVAKNFVKHLRDNGFQASQILADANAIVLDFVRAARKTQKYCSVICTCGGTIVGSAGCQLYNPPYPVVFPDTYMRLGYIWGVYVEPPYRGQGIGRHLTECAVSYLRDIGCTRVLLHASQFGRSLYERIGFIASDEMKLNVLTIGR